MQWYPEKPNYLVSFNDVLIRPEFSELYSRFDSDPYFNFYGHIPVLTKDSYKIWKLAPIIVANMHSLATLEMYKAVAGMGVLVPFHRFQSTEKQLEDIHAAKEWAKQENPLAPVSATIGLHDSARTESICAEVDIVFLELAHAFTQPALIEVRDIRKEFPKITLVVGNVGTVKACQALRDAGADVCKIGVGSGGTCTTRCVTGCGVPQLSAVVDCVDGFRCTISDGGHACGGDIVKSLAVGADFVMLGSMFAGTDETGQALGDGTYLFRGMASKEEQLEHGSLKQGIVPEGISARVPARGSAQLVVEEMLGSIRQGMSMVGAATLDELRRKAVFQVVSPTVQYENSPHILFRGGK